MNETMKIIKRMLNWSSAKDAPDMHRGELYGAIYAAHKLGFITAEEFVDLIDTFVWKDKWLFDESGNEYYLDEDGKRHYTRDEG